MVAGVRMTFGSAVFADNVADADDYVVAALRAAGVVITGKTATPEFGLPCYTETSIGPPARTPWDLTRSAGGSSGGAGAAVAAGLAPAAQGSDGGGSIRIPSSVCGLFGIKPSRGRISGGPLMPDLAGLSTNGPIARTVADAALLLDAMTVNHVGDMYTLPPLPPGETFLAHATREPGRLRIARSLQHAVDGATVHPDCVAAYEEASSLLAEAGHEVEDVVLPFGHDVVPMFEILWYSMATLAPIDPAQEGQLLPLTRYLRDRGRQLKAPELLFAQAYLQAVMRPALEVMNGYDAVLSPTLASPPVPVGYFDEVGPAENFERQKQLHAVHGHVQPLRAAGRQRSAALEPRRAAGRGHASEPDRRGRDIDLAVGAAGGRAAVAAPASPDLVSGACCGLAAWSRQPRTSQWQPGRRLRSLRGQGARYGRSAAARRAGHADSVGRLVHDADGRVAQHGAEMDDVPPAAPRDQRRYPDGPQLVVQAVNDPGASHVPVADAVEADAGVDPAGLRLRHDNPHECGRAGSAAQQVVRGADIKPEVPNQAALPVGRRIGYRLDLPIGAEREERPHAENGLAGHDRCP